MGNGPAVSDRVVGDAPISVPGEEEMGTHTGCSNLFPAFMKFFPGEMFHCLALAAVCAGEGGQLLLLVVLVNVWNLGVPHVASPAQGKIVPELLHTE